MYSRTPAYNLKVVLKETGIAADTLRAWERRYGLPQPQRTAGGHRLYSQHDIEMVKWLIARQAEGLSISRAIEHWKEIEAESGDPLLSVRQPEFSPTANISTFALDALRQAWVDACLAYDEKTAEQILNQGFALYAPELACFELLQKGIAQVGQMWFEGKASVQQEHFATALAMRRVDTLISACPPPARPQTVLVTCPPEEWHTFSLMLLTLFLRRRGLNVIYLGANVPVARMEEAISSLRPHLVVIGAQQLATAATLQRAATALRANGVQVAYGGRIFNRIVSLRERIPAHFLGENLDTALKTIEVLILNPAPMPYSTNLTPLQQIVAADFHEKRRAIEIDMIEALRVVQMPGETIDTANFFFGNELHAALELGNASHVAYDIDWLLTMLQHHHVAQDHIVPYIKMYAQVIKRHLGEHAPTVTQWMDQYVAQHNN